MTTPLCKCRVLYIGSYIPTITKDGLQGIQEPLRERYPVDETADTKGIDSWLSVWSNGLLLEYIDGSKRVEASFFQIESLHYCAAVRYVNVSGYDLEGGGEKFLPLDSPFANIPNSRHPPIFAAIFRRTVGLKVLECHAFICMNERAANALVRSCFHAYADNTYLKLEDAKNGTVPALHAPPEASGGPRIRETSSISSGSGSQTSFRNGDLRTPDSDVENEPEMERWTGTGKSSNWQKRQQRGEYETASISSDLPDRYSTKKPQTNGDLVATARVRRTPKPYDYEEWRERNQQTEIVLFGQERARLDAPFVGPPGPMPLMLPSPPQIMGGRPMDFPPPPDIPLPRFPGPEYFGPHPPPLPLMAPTPMDPFMVPPGPFPPEFAGGPFSPPPPPMMMPPPPHLGGGLPPMFIPPGSPMSPPPPDMSPMPFPPPMAMHFAPPPPDHHFMPPPMLMAPPPPLEYDHHPSHGRRSISPMSVSGPQDFLPPGPQHYGTLPMGPPVFILGPPPHSLRSFEEPAYLPGYMQHHPAQMPGGYMASYRPGSVVPEYYETYYETYRRPEKGTKDRGGNQRRPGSASSLRSAADVESYVNYEGGIYRRQYLNEKAFGKSLQREPVNGDAAQGSIRDHSSTLGRSNQNHMEIHADIVNDGHSASSSRNANTLSSRH